LSSASAPSSSWMLSPAGSLLFLSAAPFLSFFFSSFFAGFLSSI